MVRGRRGGLEAPSVQIDRGDIRQWARGRTVAGAEEEAGGGGERGGGHWGGGLTARRGTFSTCPFKQSRHSLAPRLPAEQSGGFNCIRRRQCERGARDGPEPCRNQTSHCVTEMNSELFRRNIYGAQEGIIWVNVNKMLIEQGELK